MIIIIIIIGSWLSCIHRIMDVLGKLWSAGEARLALACHLGQVLCFSRD